MLGYHRQARILGASRRHVNEITVRLALVFFCALHHSHPRREPMKILVIGSGAREHAMAWKLARERDVAEVLCSPGNPGIAAVARCIPVDVAKTTDLLAIARREAVDLTVVGPEGPLSLGVTD